MGVEPPAIARRRNGTSPVAERAVGEPAQRVEGTSPDAPRQVRDLRQGIEDHRARELTSHRALGGNDERARADARALFLRHTPSAQASLLHSLT